MRSKDVRNCSVGAFGFYLLMRFTLTGEMENPPDFTINSNWFDIKLLVDVYATNYCEEMSSDPYSKWMAKLFKQLGIVSNHLIHIGRVLGAAELELLENDEAGTKTLGNWCPDTQGKFYSTKLPLSTMRMAAGFSEAAGTFWCPRSAVIPPMELQNMVFPWVEASLERVKASSLSNHSRTTSLPTALAFLECMQELSIIVLQDAAAILALHPERAPHPLFTHIDLFRDPMFLVSIFVFEL